MLRGDLFALFFFFVHMRRRQGEFAEHVAKDIRILSRWNVLVYQELAICSCK